MKVHVLTIGDEILIGQIIDTNSSWIAQRLNLIGMKVSQMKSISDELKDIKSQLQLSLNEVDVVIITGGLGPTQDDITQKAFKIFGSTFESFGKSNYFGECQAQFVGASTDNKVNFESPKPIQIIMI